MKRLQWSQLLNEGRRKDRNRSTPRTKPQEEHRIEVERDFDRILFSTPVRRMQDKTQVFALDKNDSVRTRLTHSHEVSNLARSIGTALVHRHADVLELREVPDATRRIPALLAAVGLAHDIGNPPFGHQGEYAIRDWFKTRASKETDPLAELDPKFRNDFLLFEGNAQAVRILTRLQVINDSYGLDLTYAFLAAMLKYPVASNQVNSSSHVTKKFNFFQSEREIIDEVWQVTGLREGVRHPLCLIMEACDDIAYSVVDLEDGVKKGLFSYYDLMAWLERKGGTDPMIARIITAGKERSAKFHDLNLSASAFDDVSMQRFRVDAIGLLVAATIDAFVKWFDDIMAGTFDEELVAISLGANLRRVLKEYSKEHVYTERSVRKIELTGHQTIGDLMDHFWDAIHVRSDNAELESARPPRQQYAYSLISENYRRVANDTKSNLPLRYRELQLLTDMISGMTDSFAVDTLKHLENIDV